MISKLNSPGDLDETFTWRWYDWGGSPAKIRHSLPANLTQFRRDLVCLGMTCRRIGWKG